MEKERKSMTEKVSPPFPWFGGKTRITNIVWELLGDTTKYVEPFFGAGAVLLNRPSWHKNLFQEIINDKDMLVVNFWRAIKYAPEEVIKYVDYPITEGDLTARHWWLVNTGIPELRNNLLSDPEYYDAKIAGWWAWGLCQWIGGGSDWCAGNGKWTVQDGKFTAKTDKSQVGVPIKRPHISTHNVGLLKPNLSLEDYVYSLAKRLRYVRVVCGDWSRVVTKGALTHEKNQYVGIFLDPPYSHDVRFSKLYREEEDIAKQVNKWCVENGSNKNYRIVLCGYEGEHNNLEELGWKKIAWVGYRAYGNSKGKNPNADNRYKERIWYNESCLNLKTTKEGG